MIPNPQAKTILCFGDSNTHGQTPRGGRYPADIRWTGRLQQALGNGYDIIEEGLSSRTTDLDYASKPGRNGKTYLGPCLESHQPLALVVIMLGTNDLKIEFNRSAADIAVAIRGLVQLVHEKTSRRQVKPAEVLILGPIAIDDTLPYFQERYTSYYNHRSAVESRLLAAELQTVATEMGCAFADAKSVATPGEDGIHMAQDGHEHLATLLAQRLAEIKL